MCLNARCWLPTAFFLTIAMPVQALEQRLKLEGRWDGERIVAHEVKERDPNKDASRITLSGRVSAIDHADRQLVIGPATLIWRAQDDGEFDVVEIGSEVEVRARRDPQGTFVITKIEPATLDTDDAIEIIGNVIGSVRRDGLTEISLAGISALSPRSLYHDGRVRLRRLDDRRPDEQFTTSLGPIEITLGGELEFNVEVAGDRDLDSRDDDSRLELETGFQLESAFQITDSVSAYAELKGQHVRDYDFPPSLEEERTELRRGETWIYVDQPFHLPFSVQIGRQNFAEDREWWWDEDLDAVRMFFSAYQYRFDIAVAEEMFKETLNEDHAAADDQDILRVLASAKWRLSSALVIDVFFLHHNDHSDKFAAGTVLAAHREDDEDADLSWFGTRFSGEADLTGDIEMEYWIDWAVLRGAETRYDFDDISDGLVLVETADAGDRDGEAVDVGASLTWENTVWGPLYQPTVTLGYAFGSGDEDGDNFFRETGLNDNNGRFNGVDRFRYYGELADPELENLAVSTTSLGFRFADESSIELIHHYYRQAEKHEEHALRIRPDATGRSRDLGNEFDVVVGIEEWEHWELEFVGAYFIPGNAFTEDDDAWQVTFKLNYNF